MKVIRNLFKTVTCDRRSRFFGDEILHAEAIPKLVLMPTTWRGDLKPVLDAYLDQLAPLSNGLTLGNVLHAEEIGPVLDLGRAWLGSFSDRMLAARDEKPGAVDASEVFGQLQHLRRQMGTGDPRSVADGVRRLRDAARRVSDEGEEPQGAFSEGRRIADATARRVASINRDNAAFWNQRSSTPSLDSRGRMSWRTGDAAAKDRTAVRDAVHAANHAGTPRDRIAAMNGAAKAFWSSGESPTLVTDALRAAPAPRSVAGINAANRAFWAGRS